MENKLRRAGKLPKDKKEVVLEDKRLAVSSRDEDFPDVKAVDDLVVCPYDTAMDFGEKLILCARATTPDGMRAPTINEVRRADREIMSEVLKWVGKGVGSLDQSRPAGVLPRPREGQGGWAAGPERGDCKKDRGEDESHGTSPKLRMCIVCRRKHEPRCEIQK